MRKPSSDPKNPEKFLVNDRIIQYVKMKDMSQLELSKRMNMSQQNINYIWKKHYPPGTKFLTTFLNTFPEINPAWVLRGVEPMELTDLSKATVSDRMATIMEYYNLSVGSFAEKCGIAPGEVADIINRKTELPLSLERSISTLFTEINMKWLLYGSESMLKSSSPQKSYNQAPKSVNTEMFTLHVKPGSEIVIKIVPDL
jgi:transcriptional regulator with XRE-family HTH domain